MTCNSTSALRTVALIAAISVLRRSASAQDAAARIGRSARHRHADARRLRPAARSGEPEARPVLKRRRWRRRSRAPTSARASTASSARATIHVDGEVFRTGMTKVPLIKGATLLDARAGQPAAAGRRRRGHAPGAASPGPATFSATLEVGARADVRRPAAARSCCRCPSPAAPPRRSMCRAIRPTSTSRPASSSGGRSAGGRTTDRSDARSRHADRGVVVHARQRADDRPASRDVRLLVRRQDDSSRSATPTSGWSRSRRHDRAGRAVADRRVAAGGLRGQQRQRRVARPHRDPRRPRDAVRHRSRAAPASVPRQPRAPEQRRIVHARDRACRRFAAAQRETGEVAVEGLGTLEVVVA